MAKKLPILTELEAQFVDQYQELHQFGLEECLKLWESDITTRAGKSEEEIEARIQALHMLLYGRRKVKFIAKRYGLK